MGPNQGATGACEIIPSEPVNNKLIGKKHDKIKQTKQNKKIGM
jgi:hypothetical protein